MKQWVNEYITAQKAALDSVSAEAVAQLIDLLAETLKSGRRIFVFGNGGSASNSSHFATDLGKGASDKIGSRFKVLALNDNISWMMALANDYSYEEVIVGQLQNHAGKGDLVIGLSVSGNSPNLVKAFEWAAANQLQTVALVGARRGRMAEIARHVIVVNDVHYGRVEDVQMNICHMLCYAFMEHAARFR